MHCFLLINVIADIEIDVLSDIIVAAKA